GRFVPPVWTRGNFTVVARSPASTRRRVPAPSRSAMGSSWRLLGQRCALSGRMAEKGVGLDHNSLQRIELAKDCVGAGFLGEFEQINVVEVGFAGYGDDSDF